MGAINPKFLYRYRHLQGKHREWTKRILTDSVLHFSKPRSFNDPFDCKVHFRSVLSKSELRRKYGDLARRYMPQLNRAQRRTKVASGLKTLVPNEFISKITSGLQNAVDELGVLSLSATDRNVLLWSHYAKGHTGLCLKFVATDDTPFFGLAQPVSYSPTYPEIDLLRNSAEEHIEALLLTKAEAWDYEEEWRIIDHDGGAGDRVFPEELLVGVTFGAQMEAEDKEAVAKWIGWRKNTVQISQAKPGIGSFSLEIVPYMP